jgi:hypothetical protein
MSDLDAKRGPADATVCSAAEDSQRPDDERHRSADVPFPCDPGCHVDVVIHLAEDWQVRRCAKCGMAWPYDRGARANWWRWKEARDREK